MLESNEKIQQILAQEKPVWLELGAGGKPGWNGWLTLDRARECDIQCDLADGIPFPDSSVDRIYSSHFLEHLTFSEIMLLLAEALRVMRSGGEFSVCVPNARIWLEAYVKGESLSPRFLSAKRAHNRTTKIDYVNYIAYMNGHHKYMFDQECLLFILESSGFCGCRLREFDPDLDLKHRDHESIYATAFKP